MKTTFKVLMFAGAFMDERHLGKGLYATPTPVLHPADESIESMIEKHLQVTQRGTSVHESHKSFMNNLAKCELIEVNLEVVETPVLPVENNPAENLENSEIEESVDAMLPVTEELTSPVDQGHTGNTPEGNDGINEEDILP